MINSIGTVLGNSSMNSFQFAAKKIENVKFVCIPIDDNNHKILGEVIKIEVINTYFNKPDDIRFVIEKDTSIQSKNVFVGSVVVLGEIKNGKIVNETSPALPGSNVYKADESDLKLYYKFPKDGIEIGIIDNYQMSFVLSQEMLCRTHSSIVGQTGSGKSFLTAKIAIELIKNKKKSEIPRTIAIPLIFDTSGEFSSNSGINTNHNITADIIERFQIDESHFPLLNEKYLWILNEIFELDFKVETILTRWFSYQKNESEEKNQKEFKNLLFKIDKNIIDDFSKLKINSTRYLANKIEEYFSKLNELNPRNQTIFPYKTISDMKKLNLKIKKTDDFDIIEKIKNGLILDFSLHYDLIEKQILIKLILVQLIEAAKNGKINSKIVIFIDEAHNYVPSVTKSFCKNEILTIAREGRKYGLSLVLVSQRPRWVDPTALSQCGNIFIFRIQNSEDQKHIFDSISLPDTLKYYNLSRLQQGEVIISGDVVTNPIKCQISDIDRDFISKELKKTRENVLLSFKK